VGNLEPCRVSCGQRLDLRPRVNFPLPEAIMTNPRAFQFLHQLRLLVLCTQATLLVRVPQVLCRPGFYMAVPLK